MKDYRCPICRKKYRLDKWNNCAGKTYYWNYYCETCKYKLNQEYSKEEANQAVEAFISKFPPIMRLREWDDVETRSGKGMILEIDLDGARIYVDYGDREEWVYCYEIKVFPWEMKKYTWWLEE